MNMKKVIALAAVAVAGVACASANYIEMAAKRRNLASTVEEMAHDPSLARPSVFRAALEDLDRCTAADGVAIVPWGLTRCCPLTARAVLSRNPQLSAKVREDMLAACGYDAGNTSLEPKPGEAWYANNRLQSASLEHVPCGAVRSGILNAAVVPARRAIRARGETFVGKEGAERVRKILDALAAELNAPRFGKADEVLARLGIKVEMGHIRSLMPTDDEVKALRKRLMDGEIPFSAELQNRLCVALGVDAYNAFVKEYNGK